MYDIRDYEQPDWQDTTTPEPIPVEKPSTWLAAGIAATAVAIVAAIVVLIVVVWTGGRVISSPGTTYRNSATPDYAAFEHVYSAQEGTDPSIAGSTLSIALASVVAQEACTQLQAGVSEDDLVARQESHGTDATVARILVNAAHEYVCNGR